MYPVPCCHDSVLYFCERKAFTCSGVSNPSRTCSMVPSLLLAVKGREPGMFFLQWGYRDRKDGRLWMGAVGLNTAGRTEEPCVGLNRDTNELKPPFGHLPSPSLVECVFACHSLPSLSPTYSKKNLGIFSPSC